LLSNCQLKRKTKKTKVKILKSHNYAMIKAFLALVFLSFFLPSISFAEEKNMLRIDINTNGKNVFYLDQNPLDRIYVWYKIERFDPQISRVSLVLERKKIGEINSPYMLTTDNIVIPATNIIHGTIIADNVTSSGVIPFEKGVYIYTVKIYGCGLSGDPPGKTIAPCPLNNQETTKIDNAKSVAVIIKEKKTPVPEIEPLLVLLIPFVVIFIITRKNRGRQLSGLGKK
jgi:hypothetical protein